MFATSTFYTEPRGFKIFQFAKIVYIVLFSKNFSETFLTVLFKKTFTNIFFFFIFEDSVSIWL